MIFLTIVRSLFILIIFHLLNITQTSAMKQRFNVFVISISH